jgi:hypothetical protein
VSDQGINLRSALLARATAKLIHHDDRPRMLVAGSGERTSTTEAEGRRVSLRDSNLVYLERTTRARVFDKLSAPNSVVLERIKLG